MISLLKQWRLWILVLLLVGPVLAYVGFRHDLALAAGLALDRHRDLDRRRRPLLDPGRPIWTKDVEPIMPPLDWDSPVTFSPRDREAWKIVEDESDSGESLPMEDADLGPDLYIETGRQAAQAAGRVLPPHTTTRSTRSRSSSCSRPWSWPPRTSPSSRGRCPGGDLITLSHWRRAIQVAGYISKANDIYAMFSPILNPLSGLARLGTRELIVKPAWKNMQQNVLRWFYQAYVNRRGRAPDRAHERPAGHRRRAVSPADPPIVC